MFKRRVNDVAIALIHFGLNGSSNYGDGRIKKFDTS